MTVLGGSVTVLGASVVVSGASVPVDEPVSGALDVLGDTDSDGVLDDDVPLHPANATISPAAITTALLRSFTTTPTTDWPRGSVIERPFHLILTIH